MKKTLNEMYEAHKAALTRENIGRMAGKASRYVVDATALLVKGFKEGYNEKDRKEE